MSRLTDEQLREAYWDGFCGNRPWMTEGLRAVADAAVAAYLADHLPDAKKMVEPFGYFRSEPFGWTDCAPDDEGAVALYERPHHSEDKLEMVLPEVLFDSYAVFKRAEATCPSLQAHQVLHVLGAVASIIREENNKEQPK